MNLRPFVAAASLFASVVGHLSVYAATTTTVVDIPTRGVTQRILYVRPDTPIANLISVPGSDGILGIQANGTMTTTAARCGAIGRNREELAARGIAVTLVDQASDGRVYQFADLLEVVRYVRGRANIPTWISGASSSTDAAIGFAAYSPPDQPVGLIVGSPMDVPPAAAIVKHPATIVYHVDDLFAAPIAPTLFANFTSADAKEIVALSGGDTSDCAGPHNFWGIDGAYVQAVAGLITKYNPLLAVAQPGPDLNQHGLTGSWYEPATSGQGVELEVFPDLVAPGTALVQLSWFTFDVTAGGPERQRWYTVQGPAAAGAASASLAIYQNVGGNFNAPPVTGAQQVGSATLKFTACDQGQLDYAFSDGSGRTGSIPLTRLTQNVTCSTTGARPVNADFAFSGNWFDPVTSGQGVTIEINPVSGAAFLAWYTYAAAGAALGAAGQRWYTAQSNYSAGARVISMTLRETTGGAFDVPTTPSPSTIEVGTATLAFQSCTAATLTYSFAGGGNAGRTGSIALARVGPVPAGCS